MVVVAGAGAVGRGGRKRLRSRNFRRFVRQRGTGSPGLEGESTRRSPPCKTLQIHTARGSSLHPAQPL